MTGDLTEAFRREASSLLGFFIRRDVPAEDAADLVSDTFLAAWKSTRTKDVAPEQLRAWLFGIARKALSRYRRGGTRRTALSGRLRATLLLEDPTRRTNDETSEELNEHVRFLINCLPRIDQEIVRLVYWDGLSQEEVAVVLGKPATAVRARLSRARKILRDQLAETEDVD